MKVSRVKLLSVFAAVLVFGYGLVSLIGAEAPSAKKAPGEEPRIFMAITLSDFVNLLTQEKRVEVERILDENKPCSENGDLEPIIDFDRWMENVCLELKPVLTPGELDLFKKFFSVNPQGNGISTTTAICPKCGEAKDDLETAYDDLNSASTLYLFHGPVYCDFGIGPDSVKIYLIYASYYLGRAKNYANEAYLTCNCSKVKDALRDALQARTWLFYAIQNTGKDCSPYAPWAYLLSTAAQALNNGIYILQYGGCPREACL